MTSIPFTWRRAGALLATLALSAVLAACGSSSSSSNSASASSTTSTPARAAGAGSARGAALRACLKAHGVTLPNRRPGTNRPPGGGTPGGGLFGGGAGGGGGFAANPKLRAAFQACGARFGAGGARRFRPSSTTVTAFVACVRRHGYNMPNPNLSGSGPVFPSSIRTDPKFIAAAKPCESLLVPQRPAGAPPAGGTTTTT